MSGALEEARRFAGEGRNREALEQAWRALGAEPGDLGARRLIATLLDTDAGLDVGGRRSELARLLVDPHIDPVPIARAAWSLLVSEGALDRPPRALELDDLLIALLEETYVTHLPAEPSLTALRRHLLLSGEWRRHPRLAEALRRQATHSGGAWWFDRDEGERLSDSPEFAPAFLPPRPAEAKAVSFDNPITEKVADQYRAWPFPAWSRIASLRPETLREVVDRLDPGGPPMPDRPRILIAGCGAGREPAMVARRFPEARILAIDISETSLAEAAGHCSGLGIEFLQFDLHRIGELGRSFDLVRSTGVLHHLPDPEAGWAALAGVLAPGGVMRLMVYSKIARLRVRAARAHLTDLIGRPVTDDVLREARRRIAEKGPVSLTLSRDFYTLGGAYDLLLHPHEDPFDIPRIRRCIQSFGLDLIAFELPTPGRTARYRQSHPGDPLMRDFAAWAALERAEPFLFAAMYKFWCRRSA